MDYKFTVEGAVAGGQTWTVSGTISGMAPGSFHDVLDAVMMQAFTQLTGGMAIYGQPGVGGCKGPYQFKKLTVTLVEGS